MRHFSLIASVSCVALCTASACQGVTEKVVDDSDTEDTGSGGHSLEVNGTGGAPSITTPPSPTPNDPSGGGMGGAPIVLPPFDCTDPNFFPLRLDEGGNIIESAPGSELTDGQDGVGGADAEVGSGDLTVLLVFDKSGSMASPWGAKSRWQAGSDAVLLGLDGILDVITMGALFFPFPTEIDGEGCGVPLIDVDPQIDFTSGLGFKERWIAGACAAQPDGATPLERALEVADAAIESAEQRQLVKARMRVILVTDGEPTCEDDVNDIVGFPTKWSEMGIETHVIGLPGSESATLLLDAIAQAGGTDEHFAPLAVGDLEDEVYHLLR